MDTHYTYRVEWSEDSVQYFARCLEIDGLFATAPTAQEALARAEAAVVAYLQEREEVFGLEPPKPLSERNFSGRFMVRMSRNLHARLVMEANEQAVSLNQWVLQKLTDRKPTLDW
ncbi:toxin-antitoxin system HicB family antitoxin [Mycolicibacterium agri]|uniref:Antitoxin HicB n=1 Tax=Mycolicibacterium agri TaxID=36811 RepID=A0A2A7MZX1_MYCAG|nr:type II toxin-antitoxin system HicB family antitoxin [Mycolicibacterium agri]PEG37342.1 toxin-antitoxin system HicB family antitoxin [Mycolicibacterium agri]GFG52401.1 antitoxin HicB [Mycolicibacterium agri]